MHFDEKRMVFGGTKWFHCNLIRPNDFRFAINTMIIVLGQKMNGQKSLLNEIICLKLKIFLLYIHIQSLSAILHWLIPGLLHFHQSCLIIFTTYRPIMFLLLALKLSVRKCNDQKNLFSTHNIKATNLVKIWRHINQCCVSVIALKSTTF